MWVSICGGDLSKSKTISLTASSLSSLLWTTLLMHSTHFLMDFPEISSRNEVSLWRRSVSSEKS